ncbi:MAG: 4Fe-4S binding protein [Candidatus Hydrothermarchaeales archaeon]
MKEGEFEISTQISGDKVTYERKSTIEERTLIYDRERCVGCLLCEIPCPVDAIDLGATGSVARGLVDSPSLVVDMAKCTFCGICSETCPFNSYEFLIDAKPIRDHEDYLTYDRNFSLDTSKVDLKGAQLKEALERCASTCPRDALVTKKNSLEFIEKECIYCQGCVDCEDGIGIEVNRVIEGDITVDNEKCQGCGACRDICPTKAPSYPKGELGEKQEKTVIDVNICNFCGACEKVCPVEAITIRRMKINYRKGKEAPWTKMWIEAFEKMRTEDGV